MAVAIKYVVCAGESLSSLEKTVNSYLSAGWLLRGELTAFVDTDNNKEYLQVLVKMPEATSP